MDQSRSLVTADRTHENVAPLFEFAISLKQLHNLAPLK